MATSLGLGGCTKAGDTTCSEFASMGSSTGLGADLTAEQQQTLTDMLEEQHAVEGQEMVATVQVMSYCNIVDGQAQANADQPISNIPGLQD